MPLPLSYFMEDGVKVITQHIPSTEEDEYHALRNLCDNFLSYLHREWGNIKIYVHLSERRTNNAIERFHCILKKLMGRPHPNGIRATAEVGTLQSKQCKPSSSWIPYFPEKNKTARNF